MIVVEKTAGLATVQDLGRVGYASQGMPRGGALCPDLLRRANRALGNEEGAACVEVFGRLVIAAEGAVTIATERGEVTTLAAGEEYVVEPDATLRVRYLAIGGGVDAPVVLGSRSPLSGFKSALSKGSVLSGVGVGAGAEAGVGVGVGAGVGVGVGAGIGVVVGPDDSSAFDAFVGTTWRIGVASDRVGTRLAGPALARASADVLPSSPTVIGAIQLPAGGSPIVIGPDGPTTGGYPIIAVIARAHLDAFHALPLGASVSFRTQAAR